MYHRLSPVPRHRGLVEVVVIETFEKPTLD